MRTAFVEALCELADRDERIWLLTGDLGYSVLERFAERFPQRYVNMGVAEQNMTGVAAGLALCGKIAFTYSIASFPIMRCLEQIRNDVCYHNLNVKIVAVGGGLAYGAAGYTHHAVEDLAIMRAMPNMTVIAPGDPVEVKSGTRAIAAHPGPCYLRLGKGGEPVLHSAPLNFEIGKAILIRPGTDVTLISTGAMLESTLQAAQVLSEKGCSARVLSMPTVQPLDQVALLAAAQATGRIVTVEEHGAGGLGTAVAEALALTRQDTVFTSIRLQPGPARSVGSQTTLRALSSLSVGGIVETVLGLEQDRSTGLDTEQAKLDVGAGNPSTQSKRHGSMTLKNETSAL